MSSIFGTPSGAFFYKLDALGKIEGEPIRVFDVVVSIKPDYVPSTPEEIMQQFEEATKLTVGPFKMTKAMKKFLHVKKPRIPRKLKKQIKKLLYGKYVRKK